MANISELSNFDPASQSHYFLDSNVWIALLKYNQTNSSEERFKPYISFFEAVVQLNSISDPKVLKRVKHQPKLVLTSLLMSEIINAYLRNVAMPTFLNCKPGEGNFKKDYREYKYSDYDKQLKIIIDDIHAYSFMYEFIDDHFNSLNPLTLLKSLNRNLDFNDLFYLSLMEKKGIAIITDDRDFNSHNVNVITSNKKLLCKK